MRSARIPARGVAIPNGSNSRSGAAWASLVAPHREPLDALLARDGGELDVQILPRHRPVEFQGLTYELSRRDRRSSSR
jgi:hypothetical protein